MTIKNVIKGDGMKRTNLLLVAVAIIVLSVASVAYAGTSSGYTSWTSQGANQGTQPTPHKDFTLTTQKCSVCHAVHKANASGQLLLRGDVDNACSYCHITNQIGNIRIYGGNTDNYGIADNADSHNGFVSAAACVQCHAVHGADTMTGTVSAKILKNGGWETSLTAADYNAISGSHDGQVTLFCTKCHPYWQNASSGDINTNDGGTWAAVNADDDKTYQSHVMTTALSMTDGVGTAGNYTGQVAWIESAHCRDCHDAGAVNQSANVGITTSNNFPHYTTNAARFLLAATYNGAADTAGVGATENDAQEDGACLKCHRTASDGVGYDY